jgi:hypothetical protein
MGSANGTYVNGAIAEGMVRLNAGDELQLGNVHLRLVVATQAAVKEQDPAHPKAVRKPTATKEGAKGGSLKIGVAVLAFVACVCLVMAVLSRERIVDSVRQVRGSLAGTPASSVANAGSTIDDLSLPTDSTNARPEQPIAGIPLPPMEVAPGSEIQYNAHGVGVRIPVNALIEGERAQVISTALTDDVARRISDGFEIESLAYSVVATGEGDGKGLAELTFPVDDAQSRLAVIIDDTYIGVLSVVPENGSLTVNPDIVPGTSASKPNRYMVIRPKSARRHAPAVDDVVPVAYRYASAQPAASAPQVSGLVECWDWLYTCRKNPAGTILVFYSEGALTDAQVGAVVDAVANVLGKYTQLSLTGAEPTAKAPVEIVVKGDVLQFWVLNANVYIPLAQATGITSAGTRANLAHELAHWVQNKHYSMYSAYRAQDQRWWLEMAADNLAMLVEPAYQNIHLEEGGASMWGESEVRVGFQLAPFRWEGDEDVRNIHAQLVKLGMCDDPQACFFNQDSFADAINGGEFPFSQSATRQKYTRLIPELGRYLLNSPPLAGNTTITLPLAVSTGNNIGESLIVRQRDNRPRFEHFSPLGSGQLQTVGNEVQVSARTDPGAVYPFRVVNVGKAIGAGESHYEAAAPAMLEIQTGPRFLYSVENGHLADETGGRELSIGPIHDTLGLEMVRLVALAPDSEVTFKAKVGFADLSGDWAIENLQVTSRNSTCQAVDLDKLLEEEDILALMFAGLGTFQRDSADETLRKYRWQLGPQGIPENLEGIEFEADAVVKNDAIEVNFEVRFDVTQQGASAIPFVDRARAAFGMPWVLGLSWLGMALMTVSRGNRRRWAALILVMFAVVLSPSCEFLDSAVDVSGSIQAKYAFRKLEYPKADFAIDSTMERLWKMPAGEGNWQMDLKLVDENESISCNATYQVHADGEIYRDGVLAPPQLGQN